MDKNRMHWKQEMKNGKVWLLSFMLMSSDLENNF